MCKNLTYETLLPVKKYYMSTLKEFAIMLSIRLTTDNGKRLKKIELYNKIKDYLKNKNLNK